MAREPGPWPVETIPDDDWLYRRVAPIFIKPDGTVSAKVFMRNADPRGRKKEPDPDVSVNWDRYATPEQALSVANRPTH